MLQKHGDQGAQKHSVKRQVLGEKGGYYAEVLRETVVHEQTQVVEKPVVTRGIEVHNNSLLRETMVYKEPESKEKPRATKEAKVDKKVAASSAPGDIRGAGDAMDNPGYSTTATATEDKHHAREIALPTEAHKLQSYDSDEEEGKNAEHLHHATDSEHEYPETSDEEDEYHDEHENSGDEESMYDTDESEEEKKLIRAKYEKVTASSSHELEE